MSGWILLWKAVFIVGVTVFAGMAVWVTIGGAKDIKKMFKAMDDETEK